MAVIVQADPYNGLCRKIGYSVGLESLVERVKGLTSLYVRDRAVGAKAFLDLVRVEFGRKESAAEHFANFYGSLNLVRVIARAHGTATPNKKKPPSVPKALEPLYQLDSLSILQRLFEADDAKFGQALKVVMTQSIIEADGDIFLNAFLSDFQHDEMKVRLEGMVRTKRQLLRAVMPTQWAKIQQYVDIKNESGFDDDINGEAVPKGKFGRRTEPLSSSRRTASLTQAAERPVVVPMDYLGKVSLSRRGWAEDLAWFKEGEKTEQGEQFIENLKGGVITLRGTPPSALFWGYSSDLGRLRLKPSELEAPDCNAWTLLSAIADSYGAGVPRTDALDADEVFDLLRRCFDLYKDANVTKSLIRNNLPLYVAEPVLAAYCVAEGRQLPDLGAILEVEYKKKIRRVQRMIIRGTVGALFFSR